MKRKVDSLNELSGYGYELTMKVTKPQSSDEQNFFTWPIDLMQKLALYTFSTGKN